MKQLYTNRDTPAESSYPKLVRDKIPAIIAQDGKRPITRVAKLEDEYIQFLLAKVVEEAIELKKAQDATHQYEEIADIREVLGALQTALGITDAQIATIQKNKADQRGGFSRRIILEQKPM